MAKVLVEIPRVGLVMETARVQRWLKSVGETIKAGEPLVEVETEKTVVEIEAPVSGKLLEILAPPEEQVSVGAGIAWVEDGAPESSVRAEAPAAVVPAAAAAAPIVVARTDGLRISPSARKLAADNGIDPATLTGSGPGGRIQREDVEQAMERKAAPAASSQSASNPALTPVRRAIARAMALSNATVPQFFVERTLDWTSVQSMMAELAPAARQANVKLSVNDFLLQAVARSLMEFPGLNGVFRGDPGSTDARIERTSGAHIGLVVALEDGMVVPVLHRVETLSLVQIAALRAGTVERARAGRLHQEEAGGATFTISNLGASGPDRFTAILNPPESAILAVGRMRDAPAVVDGALGIRPLSELALTVDHRLADGKLAAEFLARLVGILQGREWRAA